MKVIEAAIKKLEGRHKEHIAVYGEGNEKRLTGRHETGSIDKFTYVYPLEHHVSRANITNFDATVTVWLTVERPSESRVKV